MQISPKVERVVLIAMLMILAVIVIVASGLAIRLFSMDNQNHSAESLPQPKTTPSKLDSVYMTFATEGSGDPVEIHGQRLNMEIGQIGMFLCRMRGEAEEVYIDGYVLLRCEPEHALVKVVVDKPDGAVALKAVQPGECELSIAITWEGHRRTFEIPILVSNTTHPSTDTRA